jgi:hypothetical protein
LDVTLCEAGEAVTKLAMREARLHPDEAPKVNLKSIEEMVADKGYHSGAVLEQVKGRKVRTYIPERQQKGQRKWVGKTGQQQAVYANRRRVRGSYGKSLLRRRGALVERSFAHCYDTGGMRRTHLRKHKNILKRQLIHAAAFNLSLIFRKLLGAGTPREWKNRGGALFLSLLRLFSRPLRPAWRCRSRIAPSSTVRITPRQVPALSRRCRKMATCTPGCLTASAHRAIPSLEFRFLRHWELCRQLKNHPVMRHIEDHAFIAVEH